jgi:hypothetical protein
VSVSAHVRTKGARLLHAGRVREVSPSRSFAVEGNSGRHLVTVGADGWVCDCPAFVAHCSHIEAVRLMIGGEFPGPKAPPQPPAPATEGGRLYTGSWRHVLAYDARGLVPVRISLGAPRWLPGSAHRWPAIRELTPVGSLFHIEDAVEFEAAYRRHLNRAGVVSIDRRFREIAAQHEGRPLVLLCFEADPADCHRSTFSRWWLENAGESVKEGRHD